MMSWKRPLSGLGAALVTTSLLLTALPRSTSAQGILPPFRFGGQPIRSLPFSIDRPVKSERNARYYFKVPDPDIPMSRFTITEVTDNFVQKGGQWKLDNLEMRICSSLGNALQKAKCESTAPLKQVTFCGPRGCEVYDAVNQTTRKDDTPYEGLPYLEVEPLEPVQDTNVMIVLSEVINPRSAVDYQFNLAIETPTGIRNRCEVITTLGHCAVGTWIVSIQNSRFD
jgi:hypothetical protein